MAPEKHEDGQVRLSKKTGFCFGVKRAVSMAEKAIRRGCNIYSLGSLIHNSSVVNELERKGLKIITDLGKAAGGATIVISSHGISPVIKNAIRRKGFGIIDTTCPFVLKAQKIARRLRKKCDHVVIAGDAEHPEVKALVDFVPRGVRTTVVKDAAAVAKLNIKRSDMVSVLSQTTQSTKRFAGIVRALSGLGPRTLTVFNTICKDAEHRQGLVRDLAGEVDVMLVVGGKNSANTKRLFEVSKKLLKRSYLVEGYAEVDRRWFRRHDKIGIASGASTPSTAVLEVMRFVGSIVTPQKRKMLS